MPNARGAAIAFLVASGIECLAGSDIDVVTLPGDAERLDEMIADAGVSGEGWVVRNESWLGTREGAIAAFAAIKRFDDEHETWIIVQTPDGLVAEQLFRSASKSGRSFGARSTPSVAAPQTTANPTRHRRSRTTGTGAGP